MHALPPVYTIMPHAHFPLTPLHVLAVILTSTKGYFSYDIGLSGLLREMETHGLLERLILIIIYGYLSNGPQVSMVYRLINHAGCWNTRRIRKSRAAGE